MNASIPISGPHIHARADVPSLMAWVLLASAPAAAVGLYQFGWPAINLLSITIAAAVVSEAVSLRLAGKSVAVNLGDGSAVLTGWLLAMSLPPWAPWWIGALGSAFAIFIGKQVFGGIGQNIFNPAMLARVALLISFPQEMTTWINPQPLISAGAPDFYTGLTITFQGIPAIDTVSGATALDQVKTSLTRGLRLNDALPAQPDPLLLALGGLTNGSLGETSAPLLLAGGLLLIAKRVISWHIPAAMLGCVAILSGGFHLVEPERYPSPTFHLLAGGMMLGAFFIATDPVTSPSTPRGRLLFGLGCGALTWLIRT